MELRILIPIFLFLTNSPLVENAKILFLVPMSTTSEKHFYDPIIHGLAANGHSVAVVASSKTSNHPPNVTEIVPITSQELFKPVTNISGNNEDNAQAGFFFDMTPFAQAIDRLYMNEDFKRVVLNQKYDLIFTNVFFAGGFYGIIHKMGVPFILVNSFPVDNYFLKDLGFFAPPSILPNPLSVYTNSMNFEERVKNYILDILSYFNGEFVHLPMLESVYKKHLGKDLPGIKEIERNASLVLTNTHFTSTYHRPLMPDVVEIGGIHCVPAKPLPKELEDFVSKSADGFIYMSFGTVLTGSSMPDEVKRKFLNVFSRMKQRVIWKWETEEMEDLPKNVLLKKWLPQQDILGHKNIRVFISHAGLMSTQQTIYHGVPVLLFPVYFDQITNGKYLEQQGIGLRLDLFGCTEQELENALKRILNEPEFKERASLSSQVFKDQMNHPVDRAVFWTNHVLKFKGAPHLRSSARDLNALQFHSLDVVAFLLTVIFSIVLILYCSVRKCLSLVFKRKEKLA